MKSAHFAYFPGSRIAITVAGLNGPLDFYAIGGGSIRGNILTIPSDTPPSHVEVLAANRFGMASQRIRITAPPNPQRSFIAVASYDDGVVLHASRPPFRALGVFGIGGAAADVAIGAHGRIAAADTDGERLTVAEFYPWRVHRVEGVIQSDEIAIDNVTHAIFASDRDVDGVGALTRILRGSPLQRVTTGETAEGIAIDERRQRIYVANVNDGTVAIVDARTMRVRTRFHAISRAFSLALSTDGSRLYVVANQSLQAQFSDPGRVVAFDVRGARPRRIAISPPLVFPLGITYDGRDGRVFVTDEQTNVIYSLDARTLRATRTPIPTCITPWIPKYDRKDARLYIPCARSNEIDVRDASTLRREPGAPFPTGGYPLAVAIWHSLPAQIP